jgi:GTP cyclohydrolase II
MHEKTMIHVHRAIRELRAGIPVILRTDDGKNKLIYPAESYTEGLPKEHIGTVRLIISSERAYSLGLEQKPHEISTDSPIDGWIDPLAPPLTDLSIAKTCEEATWIMAALQIMKLSELLPAIWVQELDANTSETWANEQRYLTIKASSIEQFATESVASVVQISEASIPLHDIGTVRVRAFRPRSGGPEHLAILIGDVEQSQGPIPVRLHSSCLTGDILGSMRCDCGEQFKKALHQSAEAGAGIVLYLNQEGRGIGIANKLKAYQLQDQGKDTVDANELLGYAADERRFDIAAHILKTIGIHRIRLMTNNPRKIEQMKEYGIDVVSRMAHIIDPNGVNDFYLETKAKRTGHMMDKSQN